MTRGIIKQTSLCIEKGSLGELRLAVNQYFLCVLVHHLLGQCQCFGAVFSTPARRLPFATGRSFAQHDNNLTEPRSTRQPPSSFHPASIILTP